MEIKTPLTFKTSDKAHADLFNDMVKVILENDAGLLEQINQHENDANSHASKAEKQKWNQSQLYKMTNDNGSQLVNIPAGGSIYNVIKSLGACSFYAPGGSGVVDSPAIGNAALRGFQLVGQNNIGVGIAIDTSGNAFCFSYHVNDIAMNWLQMPSQNEKTNGTQDNYLKLPLTMEKHTKELMRTILVFWINSSNYRACILGISMKHTPTFRQEVQ